MTGFAPSSRYALTETTLLTTPDGQEIIYLRRRFVPAPEKLALFTTHTVADGDRLDNLAAQYLGDPEQFWRIGDANRAMVPNVLTLHPGRELRICLPEGMPGVPGVLHA
jgi:nucleoid-associated protein YgaU